MQEASCIGTFVELDMSQQAGWREKERQIIDGKHVVWDKLFLYNRKHQARLARLCILNKTSNGHYFNA